MYRVAGAVLFLFIWYLDLQLPMQSVLITTKVVHLNPTTGLQFSLGTLVSSNNKSDRQVCTQVSSTNETDLYDITEILLKVALNTIFYIHLPFKYIHNNLLRFVLTTLVLFLFVVQLSVNLLVNLLTLQLHSTYHSSAIIKRNNSLKHLQWHW